jgi:ribonuclease VapC
MSSYVLDASALLALLRSEAGADAVAARLSSAAIGSVNLSEVAAKLMAEGVPIEVVRGSVESFDLDVHPFDTNLAYRAAVLREVTGKRGLSLGDRACLALAERLEATALTADRAWTEAGLETSIEIIR